MWGTADVPHTPPLRLAAPPHPGGIRPGAAHSPPTMPPPSAADDEAAAPASLETLWAAYCAEARAAVSAEAVKPILSQPLDDGGGRSTPPTADLLIPVAPSIDPLDDAPLPPAILDRSAARSHRRPSTFCSWRSSSSAPASRVEGLLAVMSLAAAHRGSNSPRARRAQSR